MTSPLPSKRIRALTVLIHCTHAAGMTPEQAVSILHAAGFSQDDLLAAGALLADLEIAIDIADLEEDEPVSETVG